MHDLILIGLPASGKTSAGRLLSQRLAMPFFDCDDAVAAAAGQPIPDIFAQQGEEGFRQLESRVLREENRRLLRRSGTVFWLDRPLFDIMSTDFQTGRPLLAAGRAALEALAAQRRPLYAECACCRIGEPVLERAVAEIQRIWEGEAP